MNAMRLIVVALCLTVVVAAWLGAAGKVGKLPFDPREVPREAQLNVVEAHADLNGDGTREVLIVVNALTGESDPSRSAEVIFGVAAPSVGRTAGKLLWARHVMEETHRPAHDGEISAVDLDGDGRSELILSWEQGLSAERIERWGEIYVMADPTRPRRVWEGFLERDTRRDRETPPAKREWVRREIDFGATRRSAGQMIAFKKITAMTGGVRVDPPREEPEWVTAVLRAAPSR